MTASDPRQLLAVARDAARAGAEVAMAHWRRLPSLVIEEKAGAHDLVSVADRDTEAAILAVIGARRPHDAVLAEESGGRDGTTGLRWAVDPIDGTTNYLYGRPDWAVTVAAVDETGTVLAGVVVEPAVGRTTEAAAGDGTQSQGERVRPLTHSDLARAVVEINLGRPEQKKYAGEVVDVLVPAVRDVRRGGSAAAALAQVATGRADIAWMPGLQPWDCAAGILLVVEAGGVVGDLAGRTGGAVPSTGDVLAAPPALWEDVRALLSTTGFS